MKRTLKYYIQCHIAKKNSFIKLLVLNYSVMLTNSGLNISRLQVIMQPFANNASDNEYYEQCRSFTRLAKRPT